MPIEKHMRRVLHIKDATTGSSMCYYISLQNGTKFNSIEYRRILTVT